jgi:hypothetical protein
MVVLEQQKLIDEHVTKAADCSAVNPAAVLGLR